MNLYEEDKPLLILAGPTAVGKSDFSVKVAKALGGECISADSIQVYKGLNIGSGKITEGGSPPSFGYPGSEGRL